MNCKVSLKKFGQRKNSSFTKRKKRSSLKNLMLVDEMHHACDLDSNTSIECNNNCSDANNSQVELFADVSNASMWFCS